MLLSSHINILTKNENKDIVFQIRTQRNFTILRIEIRTSILDDSKLFQLHIKHHIDFVWLQNSRVNSASGRNIEWSFVHQINA